MPYLLNVIYLFGLLALSPWLLIKALSTGKYRRGMWAKFVGSSVLRDGDEPCAWFHGVSVGEVHLLTQVVAAFRRRHPEWTCVISTTTETGLAEACKRFPDLAVFFWPFDFTWSVQRALRRVNPTLIVLAEGELWPNFLALAQRRGVPVAVVNGRMSPRSLRTWSRLLGVQLGHEKPSLLDRLLTALVRPCLANVFQQVTLWTMQTEAYAEAVRRLGAPSHRVHATGNVKYDGVLADRDNTRTREWTRLLSIRSEDLILVAGSTQAPEEEIVLGIAQRLRLIGQELRLVIVPRQKERFDEVAHLLQKAGEPYTRLSELKSGSTKNATLTILGDTFGDLSALWGLATVAYVGGSLDGKRGGQNMIEPAAFGAAVVFGPHVWNFRDTAERLTTSGAAIQVRDGAELEVVVRRLIASLDERAQMGSAARTLVLQQQGATERTIENIARLLHENQKTPAAA